MTRYAYDRVRDGLSMPGVFQVGHGVDVARAIQDVLLLSTHTLAGEREGQVRYLPLR